MLQEPIKRSLLFIFSAVISAIFLISCSKPEKNEPTQNIQIELSEVLSIGDESNDPNYLFTSIASIAVDKKNQIYVAENFGNHIKVFDENGHFLKQIGREGRGPGEFRMVLTMTRDTSGNLFVMDQLATSVSKFDAEGNYIDQYLMPNMQVRQMHAVNDSLHLVVYMDVDSGMALHSFDQEFILQDSFIHRDDFIQTDERFEEVMSRYLPGNFLWYDESTIYFTPVFYHGKIHQYKKNNTTWHLTNTIEGFTPEPAFEPTNPTNEKAYVMFDGREELAAIINNESRGLLKTTDGYIVHFTSIKQDDTSVFGAELYSAEGEFLGYSPIREQDDGNMYAIHIDHNNILYMAEQFGETVVKKYKFEIKV